MPTEVISQSRFAPHHLERSWFVVTGARKFPTITADLKNAISLSNETTVLGTLSVGIELSCKVTSCFLLPVK